jgi:hypothetical protein
MVKHLDHHDPRAGNMDALGSGVEEWADNWAPIIGKGMADAEARVKAAPTITTPIGYECISDNPQPNIRTTVGLVFDSTYGCFFLDVTENKIGRRVDEIAEVELSRDGLRALVELGTRMLGDGR